MTALPAQPRVSPGSPWVPDVASVPGPSARSTQSDSCGVESKKSAFLTNYQGYSDA